VMRPATQLKMRDIGGRRRRRRQRCVEREFGEWRWYWWRIGRHCALAWFVCVVGGAAAGLMQ